MDGTARLPGRRLLWGGILIAGSLVFFLTTGHNLRLPALSLGGPATAVGLLSVVVILDHRSRADFDVYRHASGVRYDAVLSSTVPGESILDPDSCRLEPAAAGPVLTCRQGAWQLQDR